MQESELEPHPAFTATLDRPDGRTAVVRVAGELDLLTAPRLEALLARLAGETTAVVLDFQALEFIDSSGVHLVLQSVQALRQEGREVGIVGASPQVVRAFELVGLVGHLPFRGPGRSTS